LAEAFSPVRQLNQAVDNHADPEVHDQPQVELVRAMPPRGRQMSHQHKEVEKIPTNHRDRLLYESSVHALVGCRERPMPVSADHRLESRCHAERRDRANTVTTALFAVVAVIARSRSRRMTPFWVLTLQGTPESALAALITASTWPAFASATRRRHTARRFLSCSAR